MSNLDDSPTIQELGPGEVCTAVETLDPRLVPLGGPRAMTVHRTLPQRGRTLVGAWCFLDHYGPDDVSSSEGMVVPRHPHTGLATVSWLFEGEIDHLDSAGNVARVRPGELNLMLAGRGITHQEISTKESTTLHGVQLWYALSDDTRFEENRFERYAPAPVQLPGATALVFLGELFSSVSPVDPGTTELLGVELRCEPDATLEVTIRPDFEYAVLAETGDVTVNGSVTPHRSLAYVPPGSDTLTLTAGPAGARLIVLGGVPLGEQIVMWWNFVGRTHDEIVEYRRRYQAEMGLEPADPIDAGKRPLFGTFPDGQRKPLPAPVLPLSTLKPRA